MNAETYGPPVDKLLTYGSLENEVSDKWPDYLALGLGPEDIPELIRMATDRELRNLEGEEEDENDVSFWAPLHAVRALGQLRAEAAIEPLLPLFNDPDDEWMEEELASVYGLIGPTAIPAIVGYIADPSNNMYGRGYASDAFVEIGKRHTEARSESIAALTHQLESFEENDYELNAFLISDLIQLKAVEAAPIIEQAFAANRVDQFIVGDWDDVQVELGLKERSEAPRRGLDFGQLFKRDVQPRIEEDIYALPTASPRSPLKFSTVRKKSKNKTKMAKLSRKKNRRRRK